MREIESLTSAWHAVRDLFSAHFALVQVTSLVVLGISVAIIALIATLLLINSAARRDRAARKSVIDVRATAMSATVPVIEVTTASATMPAPKAQTITAPSPRRIFISHASQDNEFGAQLVGRLRTDLGPEYVVWYDSQGRPNPDGLWTGGIVPGANWQDEILRAVQAADVFLAILSPAAMQSPWVADELRLAWSRKNITPNIEGGLVVVPVLRETCDMPPWLAQIQWVDFTRWRAEGWAEGERAWNALLSAVRDRHTRALPVETSGPPFDLGLLPEPLRLIGRGDDLKWVVMRLRAGGATAITALRGMGGIGKSALAAVAIRRLREEGVFPDGIAVVLCENLRDPVEVLRQALSRFAPGRHAPDAEDLPSLTAVAQKLLEGRRALIVLDNIEPELRVEQVIAPLAAAGATLLLTARQTLPAAVPATGVLNLKLLAADDAALLFVQSYGRDAVDALSPDEQEATKRIVTLLERHTMGVRLAGAYAAELGRALRRVAEEIADDLLRIPEGETPRKVEAVLARSVDALPSDGQRLFMALAAFASGEFGRQAALALATGLGLAAPEAGVDLLIRRALLDPSYDVALPAPADAERLRLHPLLRATATTQFAVWPDADRNAAQHAIARWYGDYAPRVNEAAPNSYLALMPDEANITVALDWALASGEDRVIARICDGMRIFWRDTGRMHAGFYYLRLGAAAAERIADQSGERQDRIVQANITLNLGDLLQNTGRQVEAETIYVQDLDLLRMLDDREGEGDVLSRLGAIALRRGQLEEATVYFQQSVAIAREVSDLRREGENLAWLSEVELARGRLEEAADYIQQSLAIHRGVSDRRGEGTDLSSLGEIALRQEHLEEAEGYFQQSLTIAREVSTRRGEGVLLSNLGRIALARDRLDGAADYFEQSLAIHREVDNRQEEGINLAWLGLIAERRQQWEVAEKWYRDVLALVRETQDVANQAAIASAFGQLLIKHREAQSEGCQLLRESATIYDAMGLSGQADETRALARKLGCRE